MIGDIITVKGVKCVVLDEINGNPFVIALDLDIKSPFGNSNNYKKSELRKCVESWFKDSGIKAIVRDVDLTAMDGYKGYGELNTVVAPLTFDEYRKYNHILAPHIKNWFWLVTPWGLLRKIIGPRTAFALSATMGLRTAAAAACAAGLHQLLSSIETSVLISLLATILMRSLLPSLIRD